MSDITATGCSTSSSLAAPSISSLSVTPPRNPAPCPPGARGPFGLTGRIRLQSARFVGDTERVLATPVRRLMSNLLLLSVLLILMCVAHIDTPTTIAQSRFDSNGHRSAHIPYARDHLVPILAATVLFFLVVVKLEDRVHRMLLLV